MGGQHRWASAFLAACHYIYFIIYYCIFLIWLIKLLLLSKIIVKIGRTDPIRSHFRIGSPSLVSPLQQTS